MIRHAALAALALIAAPALADSPATSPTSEVKAAAEGFFYALRNPDKTMLAQMMDPRGMIFIHDRRDPDAPRIITRPVAEHLADWEKGPPGTDEYMRYHSVLVDGDMAQVWGPYVFLLNGAPTHCGINSMSLARLPEGWRLTNTSFTMTALDECGPLGAPAPMAAPLLTEPGK